MSATFDPIEVARRLKRGEGLGESPQLVILALLDKVEQLVADRAAHQHDAAALLAISKAAATPLFPRVRYAVQMGYVPVGVPNPNGCDGFDYMRDGAPLNFLPVAGMWIDSGDGELREVDDVYLEQDGTLAVHFTDDEGGVLSHADLVEMGWRLEVAIGGTA